MSSNTMYGASPVTITISANRLIVSARYEGIEKLKKYILKVLLGLALLLGIGLTLPFAAQARPRVEKGGEVRIN